MAKVTDISKLQHSDAITITGATDKSVNFTLVASQTMLDTLCGHITDGTSPLESVNVTIYSSDKTSIIATTLTDSAGFYSFNTLNPNNYILTASKTNFIPAPFTTVTIIADQSTVMNLSLKPFVNNDKGFYGIVSNVSDGSPIENARIDVVNSSNQIDASTYSDIHGHYTITNLEDGTYNIIFSKNGFVAAQLSNAIIDEATPFIEKNQTLSLYTPGVKYGSISGYIMNKDEGYDSVWVGLYEITETEGEEIRATTIADSTGFYAFTDLTDGSYLVLVKAFSKK